MTRFYACVAQVLAMTVSGCGLSTLAETQATPVARGGQQSAVVVELFTSQGCSSCPPADQVLIELNRWGKEQQAPVFCLSFHVDYWNQLGWTDPYSSKAYSDRQRAYAAATGEDRIYTPQMIVNGRHAFVGSKSDEAFRFVESELKEPQPIVVKLSAAADAKREQITVLYDVDGEPAGGVLNVALVQNESHNDVPVGENAGRDLAHVNVVRAFKTVDLKHAASGKLALKLPAKIAAADCGVIAYVQDEKLRVVGASRVALSNPEANRVKLSDANGT